jgi:hypothetical protein
MVKLLAVVTLHETNLAFVHFYPDFSMVKAQQSEYFVELNMLDKITRKMGKLTVVGRYMFDPNDIKNIVHQPEMSSAGPVNGTCHITDFIGFCDFG